MNKTMNRGYKEVRLDNNGRGADKSYHNPLSKVFQYEYALYTVVSRLFESVRCRSLCISNLEAYFMELPAGSDEAEGQKKTAKKTQEKLIAEVSALVERDVVGKISFPQINICAAEAAAIPEEDGTHTFVFTDGIYGFKLHMTMPGKGKQMGISVSDLYPKSRDKKPIGEEKQAGEVAGSIENAALFGAA